MSDDIVFGKSSKNTVEISSDSEVSSAFENNKKNVYDETSCVYKQEIINRISNHDFDLSDYIEELIKRLEVENNSKYNDDIKNELRRRVENYIGFWWDLNFERISGDIVRSYLRGYSKVYTESNGTELTSLED